MYRNQHLMLVVLRVKIIPAGSPGGIFFVPISTIKIAVCALRRAGGQAIRSNLFCGGRQKRISTHILNALNCYII